MPLVAVEHASGDGLQDAALQAIAQGSNPGALLGHMARGEFRGYAQADDERDILGPAAAAALLVSADDERGKGRSAAHIERAHTLGGVELVPR